MRKLILITLFFSLAGGILAQRSVKTSIYFTPGSVNLGQQAQKTLDSLISIIKKQDIKNILVAGHTDDIGAEQANQKLGEARAHAVFEWLATNLGAPVIISLQSFGESMPASSAKTSEARALNRRVEIIIEYAPLPSVEEKPPRPSMTIDDLYLRLKKSPQAFCIDNTKDTFLVARHGTIVYIRANSIQMPRGYVCDPCITVEIKEALFKSDIVRENLTTVASTGEILVSQSMVSVNFSCEGNLLPLTEGSDYVVLAPTDSAINAAGIFEGRWNDHDDHFAWDPASDAVIGSFPANRATDCNGDSTRDVVLDKPCGQCTFLFCGMKKWMKGWFNEQNRKEAREHFACRKTYKKTEAERRALAARRSQSMSAASSPPRGTQSSQASARLEELYKTTDNRNAALEDSLRKLVAPPGIDTITDPCERMRALRKATGIPDSAALKTMMQRSIDNMKANGNPIDIKELDKLQYYAYNVNFAGWSNIDWMLKVPDADLEPITVTLAPSEFTQVKLIFKNRRTVLPPQRSGNDYIFPMIPKGEPAWLLMINTETGKGKVAVELRDIVTGKQAIKPELDEMSPEAFVQLLDRLNGK